MTKKISRNKAIRKRFLYIFLPLAFLVIVITVLIFVADTAQKTDSVFSSEKYETQLLAETIADDFELVVSDLLILSESENLRASLVNGDVLHLEALSQEFLFLFFSQYKGLYDQIRYLDESGMEIVRVNFNNGKPFAVSADQLQNKEDRYYFQDTFQLEKGEVYVSPLDLNVENGEIEQPLKPMIRFGTPVFDGDGQKKGIVILNYFGANILQHFESFSPVALGETFMLNAAGYYLKGNIPEEEWGFMYSDRGEQTFGNTFSDSWKQINDAESGQFQDKNGLFTFNTIHPILEAWKSSTGSGDAFEPSDAQLKSSEYYWKIVLHVSPNDLILSTRWNLIPPLIIDVVLILAIGIGTWRTTSEIDKRKQAEEDLAEEQRRNHEKLEEKVVEVTHDLGERLKELKCLYGISQILELKDLTPEEIFQNSVNIIPPGWHYPEITCARILLRGDEYITANFEETIWKQEAEILLNSENIGLVEVFYLKEMPVLDEGPFLKEERNLINAIAEMLGNEIDRKDKHLALIRQIDRVAALRAIDTAIISSQGLGLTLDIILNNITSQMNVDASAILLLEPNNYLKYSAHVGFRANELVETANIRFGSSLAGLAALELRFVTLNDLDESKVPFEFTELMTSEGFLSYFAVPLLAKGETLGILEAYTRRQFSPDTDWIEFFKTIAQQAAIAIESVQSFEGLKRAKTDLEVAYDATLEGWAQAIDLRDNDIKGHSKRVTALTLDLANSIGISQEKLIHMSRGALLHDIGKLGIPDEILHKPGKLTEDEWGIMQKHPIYAFEMLSQIEFLEAAIDIPYCHHEKWDGTGYPRGLKEKEIPLAARIFSIVDVWDALRSDRPYRKAWSKIKSTKYIEEQSGKYFDPEITKAFLKLLKKQSGK